MASSRSLGVLSLDLVAKTGAFIGGMNKAERETAKSSRAMRRQLDDLRKTAVQAGAVFGTALVGATALIIKNTADAAREQAQLAAVLKSTGGVAGQTQGELNKMADSLQQVSTFAAGNITEMQSLLLTFTKIQGDVFPKAQQAVLDMAQALGTDLKSQALQLGKALNDPIKGITSLSRAGVQFTADQKEMIKSLVEAGDVVKAQELILAELETQFGGSARAASETLGGALILLKNNFNDLLEGDSQGEGVKGATQAIRDLSVVMADPQTKQAFASVIESVAGVTAEIVKGIAVWTNYIAKVNEMRGLATDNTLLDAAPYDKVNQRLSQVQERLSTLQGRSFLEAVTPAMYVRDAATQDAGYMQQREAQPGGFNPYSRSGEIEFLLKERERLIREGTERIKQDIASASAPRVFDGGTTVINAGEGFGAGNAGMQVGGERPSDRGAAEADRKAAEAKRDLAEQIREATRAQDDFLRMTEDLSAEMGGPLAKVQLDYIRREDELISLAKLAGLTNEELAGTLELLEAARLRDVDAIMKQAEAEAKRAKEAAEAPLINQMDGLRDTTAGFFADLAKNGEDAIDRLQDYLLSSALESIGRQIAEGLFGDFGTTGSGSKGGWIADIFSSLFGGARASGGPVYPGKAYLVGERGPELIRPMGAGMVSSASETRAAMQGGRSGTTNVTFVLPGRNDMRTESQRQSDLARATSRQLARGTA